MDTATLRQEDENHSDSTPVLQLLGLPGMGKTSVITTYLSASNTPFAYVDCSLAAIDPFIWGGRGPLRDVVLTPMVQELWSALQKTLTSIRLPDPPLRVSTPEAFVRFLKKLLGAWAEALKQEAPSAILPTPVLVFDDAPALTVHYSSCVQYLCRLSRDLRRLDVGVHEPKLPDVVVVFVGQRPVICQDIEPPPTIWFSSYDTDWGVVLEGMFNTIAVPVALHVAKRLHGGLTTLGCGMNDIESFHQPAALEHRLSDAESSSESLDADHTPHSVPTQTTVRACQRCKDGCMRGLDSNVLTWDVFYPVNCPFQDAECVDISESVLQQIWKRFLPLVGVAVARNTVSDFHETLVITRRLWALYILPLLQLRPRIRDLLGANEMDGFFEELRTLLERHVSFRGITTSVYAHHLKLPMTSQDSLPSILPILPSPFPASHIYVTTNYFEAPALSLIQFVAAFLCSFGTATSVRSLIEGRKRRKTQQARSGLASSSLTHDGLPYLPKPFPLQRWLKVVRYLSEAVNFKEGLSFCELHQLTVLTETKFITSVGCAEPTARLHGSARYICLAPLDAINDAARRIELPLLDYLANVQQ